MWTLIGIIACLSVIAIAIVYVIECRELGREIERLEDAKRKVAGMVKDAKR